MRAEAEIGAAKKATRDEDLPAPDQMAGKAPGPRRPVPNGGRRASMFVKSSPRGLAAIL